MVGCPSCGGTYILRVGHIDSEDGPIIVKYWECEYCHEKVDADESAFA